MMCSQVALRFPLAFAHCDRWWSHKRKTFGGDEFIYMTRTYRSPP